MRYALRGPPHLSLANVSSLSKEGKDSERFEELVRGIQFSKKFILSYQLVLLGLLIILSLFHWASKFRAWRRRRKNAIRKSHFAARSQLQKSLEGKASVILETGGGSCSSSSTIREEEIPKLQEQDGEHDEQSALLPDHTRVQKPRRRWPITSRIRAWLVYQPRPIPVINKALPSNGTTLAVLSFIGLQIFYTIFRTPLSLSTIFVFADRASLVFVANLPLLYLFAAKNQPIKLLTGYSYESLNIFHRRLGEIMCLLALLHSVAMIGVWYTILQPAGISLIRFLLIKMILLGIGAFVAYEALYLTSLGSFRQRWYELFLGLHVFLQVAALVLVWFHHHGSRPYVGVALCIFLVDRLVYRIFVKSTTLRASLEVKEDKRTVVLQARVRTQSKHILAQSMFGASLAAGWKATEHVFLTVPSIAPKHLIQAHPFTIASKAPSTGQKKPELELIIRGQDGFSGDLVRYAQGHRTVNVRLDGPYGSQSAVHSLKDSDHAVIVAGGSGVAVAWPLLWSVIDAGIHDLEHSTVSTKTRRILFLWIIRERSHIIWLGEARLQQLQARGVKLVIPAPTAENGRPDVASIIAEWIGGLDCQSTDPRKIGVVASGPDGMNRAVRNMCASLVREGEDVTIEVEKFGW